MARRPAGRARGGYDYQEEDPGYSQRRPRRGSGNQGLWIALGAALILGLVMILILTGGESDEEVQESARAALEQLLIHCVDNNEADGARMVETTEILREVNPDFHKTWANATEAERVGHHVSAFRMIRRRVIPNVDAKGRLLRGEDLGIRNKTEISGLFLNATYRVFEAGKRVDISFERNTYQWNAMLRRTDSGWLLSKLLGPN